MGGAGRFYGFFATASGAGCHQGHFRCPALRLIKDQYPRTLLTLDEINAEADYDGIRKRNALRWMLGKD
ncbi:MAG: hypothetical protein IJS96_02200 [Schwartzia sp.]|nr:hypothetical protein [Schwartzia sp. (in: firmicutes)]